MTAKPIRTLIVDDSAVVRKRLTEILSQFPEIEVVGTAMDPYIARDKILELNPDVITLDIEMPRMDGITFLKRVMKYRPMPVIILSSLTTEGSAKAMEALQAGAVDVLAKPSSSFSAYEDCSVLLEKIMAASRATLKNLSRAPETEVIIRKPAPAPERTSPVFSGLHEAPRPVTARHFPARQLILVGASTGGTEAIKSVLTNLPAELPGICLVQHIPAYFSAAFASRLNDLCRLEVREAKNGDVVRPGLALIAPGGFHMVLKWVIDHYRVELTEGPQIHHQRPAVDVLFDSAFKAGGAKQSLAILLTGMGSDGANGMLTLRQGGAATVAQNEESCVVFGMPREAIRLGAAQQILALDRIPGCIERFVNQTPVQEPAAPFRQAH